MTSANPNFNLASAPINLNPVSTPEIIQLGVGDTLPLDMLLAHLILMGMGSDVGDPDNMSLTMEAFNRQAALTTPVFKGPQGNPGPSAQPLIFEHRIVLQEDDLPTDLGDTVADLGRYYVMPVFDDTTGAMIATTIYVWMGTVIEWVQLPVGTSGPGGPYPNIQPSLIMQPDGTIGPTDTASWLAVDDTDAYAPQLQFNLQTPQGLPGGGAALGSLINVDTTGASAGDLLFVATYTTPGPPAGVQAFLDTSVSTTLAPGTYTYGVTCTLPNGETTASTASVTLVNNSASAPEVIWDLPPGNIGFRIYRSQVNQATLTELVGVQPVGSKYTEFVDLNAPSIAASPPTVPDFPAGDPVWVAQALEPSIPLLYTVPSSAFNNAIGIEYAQVQPTVCTYAVPPQPYPWVPIVFGSLTVSGAYIAQNPLLVGAHIMVGDPINGTLLADGRSQSGGTIIITPGTGNTAYEPTTIIVPANHVGSQGTIYVVLDNDGLGGVYDFNSAGAQLFIMVLPVNTVI